MIETLPVYISFLFIFSTLLSVFLLYRASKNSKWVFLILLPWLILQAFLGFNGFYHQLDGVPPRLIFLGVPPGIFILILFFTAKGRRFIDQLDIKKLTYLHLIRIPVELVLLLLFMNGVIPELMTFEGWNFDILSGLSAPLIAYYCFSKENIKKNILLVWNFICLGLLINIVTCAVLSVPTPFQLFGISQPNVAVLFFPFVWLPCCVVPIVLFSHLVVIKKMLTKESDKTS